MILSLRSPSPLWRCRWQWHWPTPDKGLVTAVVAGFLISALGGSRFQIGGPTGAFVVVVFGVIAKHGYDGLMLATVMAGVILLIAGWAKFGTWIKYIPEPVVTGFTSGIAIIIFSSQVKDLLGLNLEQVPADFIEKWQAMWAHRESLKGNSIAIAGGSLVVILLLRRYAPRAPGFLIAVVAGSFAVWMLQLPIPTIGSRFGQIANTLPMPHLPTISWPAIRQLVPSAFTIAFLAGVESLLSAVVADGMTGRRHRSNCELVAQGIANMASACFGGLPATGAIARTATNIRSGARSPIAGWRSLRNVTRAFPAALHGGARSAVLVYTFGQLGRCLGDRGLEHERTRTPATLTARTDWRSCCLVVDADAHGVSRSDSGH